MKCRACQSPLRLPLIDLGTAPPSNAFLIESALNQVENWVPLKVMVCEQCWLVQTVDYRSAETLFDADYVYFSSYSSSWLAHARRYVERVIARFGLDERHRVVEIAANDGYLLQYFAAAGIPCWGVEPTASTARAARAKGLEIREVFFGAGSASELSAELSRADLIIANNVLAHVPDINDFLAGFSLLLAPTGVITFEFPHLLRLLQAHQFDTLYHEHYSYLSLSVVERLAWTQGLEVFDVEQLATHGGSLRLYLQHRNDGRQQVTAAVSRLRQEEQLAGLDSAARYATLAPAAERIKHDFLRFLLEAKAAGKRVVGYGAAAKGNTLLNYAGVRQDLLAWVADASPHKQGRYLPGSRIPVVSPARLLEERPDYVVVLPWNLVDEISAEWASIQTWGGRFVTVVPELTIR